MTRPYFQVHGANTVTMSKWRRLTAAERGALLTIWMLSSVRDPEGVWASREALIDDLEADGVTDCPDIVDRLISLRWIDCGDTCTVHDWIDWQPALSKTEAERKREQRARERGGQSVDSHEVSGHVETRRDLSGSRASSPLLSSPESPPTTENDEATSPAGAREAPGYPKSDSPRDGIDAYYEATGSRAWGRPAGRWIEELCSKHGLVAFEAALIVEMTSGRDKLLERVDVRLSKQAARVEAAKAKEPKHVDPLIADISAALGATGAYDEPKLEATPEEIAAGEAAFVALRESFGSSRHKRTNGVATRIGDVLPSMQGSAKAGSLTGDRGSETESPAVLPTGGEIETGLLRPSAPADARLQSRTEPGERVTDQPHNPPDGRVNGSK